MDSVEQVAELTTDLGGIFNLIILLVALLVAVVFVVKNLKEFKHLFNIKNGFELHEEEQNKKITELKSQVDTIKQELEDLKLYASETKAKRMQFQDEISTALNKIQDDMLEEKIERIRGTIIDFYQTIQTRDCNKEAYTYIFDLYSKYEKIIKDNGLVNGYLEISMEYIRKRYKEQLNKGFDNVE